MRSQHVDLTHKFLEMYFVREKVLVAPQPLPKMSLQALGMEASVVRKGRSPLQEDLLSLPSSALTRSEVYRGLGTLGEVTVQESGMLGTRLARR